MQHCKNVKVTHKEKWLPFAQSFLMTKVFHTIDQLAELIYSHKKEGQTVAFVPTMGALHEGHASLIIEAKKKHPIVVSSIFVNPTQFNDPSDLEKYPRTLEKDTIICREAGLDYLYVPTVHEIYPPSFNTKLDLDLNGLDLVMEGKFRPGHFDGVCQVVKRLLDLVMPTHLYMGQKDFQQFTIIQYMLHQLKIPVELVVIETSREKSGLARSSRNTRLSPAGIKKASVIYRTMSAIKEKQNILSVPELENYGMKRLKRAGFEPEYVTISDSKTLKAVDKLDGKKSAVLCLAAWLEGVRLIDNILL